MYLLCKVHQIIKKKQVIKQSCSFFINFTLLRVDLHSKRCETFQNTVQDTILIHVLTFDAHTLHCFLFVSVIITYTFIKLNRNRYYFTMYI